MLLELLQKRRSVRQFQDKQVEKEKVDHLVECMLRAPSSRDRNPWEFIVVDNPETIEALSQSKPHGASFVKKAPLAVVVCADPDVSDVWVEDCSIAAMLIHLAAADLGLGSCWVQLRLREHAEGGSASDYAAKILQLREGMEVQAIIAMGYPTEEKPGHAKEKLLWDKVHNNLYGKK